MENSLKIYITSCVTALKCETSLLLKRKCLRYEENFFLIIDVSLFVSINSCCWTEMASAWTTAMCKFHSPVWLEVVWWPLRMALVVVTMVGLCHCLQPRETLRIKLSLPCVQLVLFSWCWRAISPHSSPTGVAGPNLSGLPASRCRVLHGWLGPSIWSLPCGCVFPIPSEFCCYVRGKLSQRLWIGSDSDFPYRSNFFWCLQGTILIQSLESTETWGTVSTTWTPSSLYHTTIKDLWSSEDV